MLPSHYPQMDAQEPFVLKAERLRISFPNLRLSNYIPQVDLTLKDSIQPQVPLWLPRYDLTAERSLLGIGSALLLA